MKLISVNEGSLLLLVFGTAMLALVYWSERRSKQTKDSFLVADRNIGWVKGALSIAVSWIWAPAIFIASLQAYTKGAAGAFWFIAPNVVCFFVFAPVAVRLRRIMPRGYTLPQYMCERYSNDVKTHLAFVFVFFSYQLGAIIINALAGGMLLHLLSGMTIEAAILAVSGIALSYSLISGLRASVLTDVVQMAMVMVVAFALIPWAVYESGGIATVFSGLGGVSGEFRNMFHPGVAYAFGIAMTFGLISGPMGDQMFFQRTFACRRSEIAKTFVAGGLIFALVPLLLCSLGFIAAAPEVAASFHIEDSEMVGPAVIGRFLPRGALLLFALMALAGLCSTLDSAYCAISSLGTVDIYRRYLNPNAGSKELLASARGFMLLLAVIGTGIALLQPKLLWMHLIYGALASCGFFPTILSIFWKRLSSEGAFLSLVLSLLVGLPLSIYANVVEDVDLIVLSAVLSLGIGLVICLLSGIFNSPPRATLPAGIIEDLAANEEMPRRAAVG